MILKKAGVLVCAGVSAILLRPATASAQHAHVAVQGSVVVHGGFYSPYYYRPYLYPYYSPFYFGIGAFWGGFYSGWYPYYTPDIRIPISIRTRRTTTRVRGPARASR